MLFARFLAENNLLIEPEIGIAISMEECEELARERGEDPYAIAARFAQRSLPQIFREDNPVLELALPPETQRALDRLLDSLATEVFTADDSLGWTYQFWQSKRKKEVNESGNKIGADELPAVTQLFTEHYMVQFLYHNTIGAWHAGKVLAANPNLAKTAQSEQELRDAVRLRSQGGYDFEYLRFVREEAGDWLKRRAKPGDVPVPEQSDESSEEPTGPWRPAAGTFDGWPKTAKEIKVLDPCCGSGHFLNEGLQILVRLRMDEEGLGLKEAIKAVLTDNLHGLEIDPRCAQIAAFNLALAAWKLVGKPIELPPMHIACSGLSVGATKGKWISLAGDDPRLRAGMGRLYDLFEQAPVLGSLIDPKALKGDMFEADFSELQPLLQKALEVERDDDEKFERAIAAQGMAKAAELLSSEYTLAITNVPYLGRAQQCEILKCFAQDCHPDAKANLGTMFVERMLHWLRSGGTAASVSPQNWLFLTSYERLRRKLLVQRTWNLVSELGAKAFETPMWDLNIQLGVISALEPVERHVISGINAASSDSFEEKRNFLRMGPDINVSGVLQSDQLKNPDARVIFIQQSGLPLLSTVARFGKGSTTGDKPRFLLCFWELIGLSTANEKWLDSPSPSVPWSGRWYVTSMPVDSVAMSDQLGCWIRGHNVWNLPGIALVKVQLGAIACYDGERFDDNVGIVAPHDAKDLPALWAYCQSGQYVADLRTIDKKLNVTAGTLTKVPFNLAHWQKVAAEKYPNGLPEPQSDDPTQWLFHGHPAKAEQTTVLQVAAARLLGYRWPAELDPEMDLADEQREWVTRCDKLLEYADEDGIVCIPSIRGESPAVDRLRALVAAAFGDEWTPGKERDLIVETGSNATDLDTWLRNDFFEQHCKLFHNRPFIWHIWDGRKRDGFHALVNYHKLAEGDGGGRRTLENLTYSYLGDWITRQQDGVRRGLSGAEGRLATALELKARLVAILKGEPPFDLFIRWKSLAEQPISWEPDINDGVRLNARPFMASDLPNGKKGAGIFRWKPNITWKKDRGKEPISLRPKSDFPWFWGWDQQTLDFLGSDDFDGNRWNDLHYTNPAKQTARDALKQAGR